MPFTTKHAVMSSTTLIASCALSGSRRKSILRTIPEILTSVADRVDDHELAVGRDDLRVAEYLPERKGDVKHSQADNARAVEWLGYEKIVGLEEGLRKTIAWCEASRFSK